MSSLKLCCKKRALHVYRTVVAAAQALTNSDFLHGRVNQGDLRDIVNRNRGHLNMVNQWIPQGLLHSSVFHYGILPEHERLLSRPVDRGTTHADLLSYLARNLKEPGRYLELGVSVGKTFWQVMLSRPDIECWGFDIEEINPVLRKDLQLDSRDEWPTPDGSPKKTPSSISRFTHQETGQKVVYICADIFDPKAWSFLDQGLFNLILSDALHSPEALDYEWKSMVTCNVFNPRETIIMWDDLDGEMRSWFERHIPTIAEFLSIEPEEIGTFYMNGWLGQREFPHRLGLALRQEGTR